MSSVGEQLTIFGLVSPDDRFCFDDDINEIVKMLDNICVPDNVATSITKEWQIWTHVPRYGFRLSYIIDIKEKLHEEFVDKLYEVMKFAEDRRIELSAHSLGNKLYLFSTFLDNRQKVKQDREFRYTEVAG